MSAAKHTPGPKVDPLVARSFDQRPEWAQHWAVRHHPNVLTFKTRSRPRMGACPVCGETNRHVCGVTP